MKILVVGEGAWGTAIACAMLPEHTIYLWCADSENALLIQSTGINQRYMPDVQLPKHILAISNPAIAVDVDMIFFTTPMRFLEAVLTRFAPYMQSQSIFMLCKGIDTQSLELPTQMAQRVLGKQAQVLMGPSFAKGVIRRELTGLVHAAMPDQRMIPLDDVFASYMIIEQSRDLIGVQLAAAYKNVLALGAGMLSGMQTGANTQALFFTRVFNEMRMLIRACGGDEQTCYGLAGLGDLFLTATSTESRNFRAGQAIGSGQPIVAVLAMYPFAEGPNTIQAVQSLQTHFKVKLPISSTLYTIMQSQNSVESLLIALAEQRLR